MIINPAQQIHGEEEMKSAEAVIRSGRWAGGESVLLFEKEIGRYLGVRHVETVNSGSSANLAAISCLKTGYIPEDRRLRDGDEVITTALCFPTTVAPIVQNGAVPVFVDVEEGTWNIDPRQVEEMITRETKAIIVAHALGNPFNVDEIMRICQQNGLWLVEDNCDGLGSEWNGKKTGSFGDVGTSSFYPAHHISTGEGGAVYTSDSRIHRALMSVINWGRDCTCRPGQDNRCGKRYNQQFGDLPFGYDHKNTYSEFGYNFKMTDIQASLGLEQMKRLDGFGRKRRENHRYLRDFLSGFPEFELPEVYEGADPSWFGFVLKARKDAGIDMREMSMYLDSVGIRSRAFFCGNITRQPVLTGGRFKYRKHPCLSVSDDVMNNAFWIGVHPGIGERELEYMTGAISEYMGKLSKVRA